MIVGDVIHNVTNILQWEHRGKTEDDRRAIAAEEARKIKSREKLHNEHHLQRIAELESNAIDAMNEKRFTQKVLDAARAEIELNPLRNSMIPFFTLLYQFFTLPVTSLCTLPVRIHLFKVSRALSYNEIFENPKVKDLVKFIKSEGLKIELSLFCDSPRLDALADPDYKALEVIVPRKIVKAIRKSVIASENQPSS